MLATLIFLRIFSTNEICSILVLFETIRMSSMNACACEKFLINVSITF